MCVFNGCVPRELAKILSPSREHRLTCYTYRAQYDSNYWFDKKESGIEGFESSSTGTETIPARFQQCLCTSVSGGISFALTPAPRHPSTVHSPHVSVQLNDSSYYRGGKQPAGRAWSWSPSMIPHTTVPHSHMMASKQGRSPSIGRREPR